MYWSSSWARILNVQDIITERTKEESSNIPYMCIPSTTIAGAGQHLFNTCVWWPRTEDVGLPTKFQFNVRPALQPIAGSIPVNRPRRWPITNPSLGVVYTLRKHVSSTQLILFQCWLTVFDAGPTLKQHLVIVPRILKPGEYYQIYSIS